MRPLAELLSEPVEHLGARSGERHACALGMEGTGDRRADAAGCSGDQRGGPGQIEHGWHQQILNSSAAAAISSGVDAAMHFASGSMRLLRLVSTRPAPSSTSSRVPWPPR